MHEAVFTRGATEGINIVASGLVSQLKPGDEVCNWGVFAFLLSIWIYRTHSTYAHADRSDDYGAS